MTTAASTRRRLGSAERRESIVAAALPQFAASGYERTRVADVAARVGVTEPVVFQNFDGKAALFAAVLERATGELGHHLESMSQAGGTVAELLRRLMAPAHLDRLHGVGGLGVIFAEAAGSADPRIRAALRRAHVRAANSVARLLHRGQAEGSIRGDVDATALAWLVLSHIHAQQFRRAHGRASPVMEDAVLEAVLGSICLR